MAGVSWRALLFPEPERTFVGERTLRITLRTAHIAAMALLFGGHFFEADPERLAFALHATLITGALFVLLEVHGTLDWLFQVRGLVTLAKIGLLALVPHFEEQGFTILLVILVLASVSSHAPSRLRYWSVVRHRRGEVRKG